MGRRRINGVISIIMLAVVLGVTVSVNIQKVRAEEVAAEEVAAEDENNSVEEDEQEKEEDTSKADKKEDEGIEESIAVTVPVPIYNYDIVNVVVPTSYAVAFNPYSLPIKMKNGIISTEQVVAQNYGIINKSTRDKIITATLTIKDGNDSKIVFVDSREEALNADKDTYAVYLAAVPADDSRIKIDNADADIDTSAEALTDVVMNKAKNSAVTLKEGKNHISFKLSKAVYGVDGSEGIVLELSNEEEMSKQPELFELAADSEGVTAFTFDGVMNPNADWTKLTKSVKISVTYTYENAIGDEKIIDGTGSMIEG